VFLMTFVAYYSYVMFGTQAWKWVY
jgi:hypothetical protein